MSGLCRAVALPLLLFGLAAPALAGEPAPPPPPELPPPGADDPAPVGPKARPPKTKAGVRLRPIDKATVRIVGLSGLDGRWVRSDATGLSRYVTSPRSGHGTGVAISPDGIVLTAKHVVEDRDWIGVMLPGQDDALPARVLYAHPTKDIAFLEVPSPLKDVYPLPKTTPPLTIMDRVSVSGYPIDAAERIPAATSGEISRQNNDGRLQLAMSLNPGNSGGAVVSSKGHIVGVVVEGGDVKKGVQGIVLAEPVSLVLDTYANHVANAPRGPAFTPEAVEVATALSQWLRQRPFDVPWNPAAAAKLRVTSDGADPEIQVLLAARFWDMLNSLREELRIRNTQAWPPEVREQATALRDAIDEVLAAAVNARPELTTRYPFAKFSARTTRVNRRTRRAAGPTPGPIDEPPPRKRKQHGPVWTEFKVSIGIHAGFAFDPLIGLAAGLTGNFSIVNFGDPDGVTFSFVVGAAVHAGAIVGFTATVAPVELGGALRVGRGFLLEALYSPGYINDEVVEGWNWEGFRVTFARMLGPNWGVGAGYTQLGRGILDPLRMISTMAFFDF